MDEKGERLQILEMIENGLISAEEGIRLLTALGDDSQAGLSAGASPMFCTRRTARSKPCWTSTEASCGQKPNSCEKIFAEQHRCAASGCRAE